MSPPTPPRLRGPDAVVAIVPLNALSRAKSRLSEVLTAQQRRALTAWMFHRVMRACAASAAVDEVLVVAGDQAGADLAAGEGAVVVLEPRAGLAAALAAADRAVDGAAASVVVVADVPLARGEDLDAVWAAGRHGTGRVDGGRHPARVGAPVVVAPTRDGGTAALLRRPPDVIGGAFGGASAGAHQRAAARAGRRPVRLDRARLALDVDTLPALRALAAVDAEAAAWLARIGLLGRRCAPGDEMRQELATPRGRHRPLTVGPGG